MAPGCFCQRPAMSERCDPYCPDPTSFTSVTTGFPFKPIESLPVILPCCTGANVTLTVQLAPAARDVPQLFVSV